MAEVEAPAASTEAVAMETSLEPVESEAVAAEETAEPQETPAVVSDHKRKREDLEAEEEAPEKPEAEATTTEAPEKPEEEATTTEAPAAASEVEGLEGSDSVQDAIEKAKEFAGRITDDAATDDAATDDAATDDAKRPRLDGEADGSAADGVQQVQKLEPPLMGNGQNPTIENLQPTSAENLEVPAAVPQQSYFPSVGQQPMFQGETSSRKIEIPNNKVGVLIGRAGETIRLLQYNSGAKLQITRDADSDPQSSTRPVELIGTLENINKAEQLIKDVIAEADAGGSPSLVARGFGTAQSGAEQLQIQVPNEKVGMIIGKGGETIKNLQTRSGARIQLIPQHLPEGDVSKERTVRISGNKKQIEAATEMIKEVMNQVPVRPSPLSGGFSQQIYRPRGPTVPPQWGPRALPPAQPTSGYDYQQRGTYPSQTTQYTPRTYGGYPQQALPRGSFGTGWDQRPGAPVQTPAKMGGYDYYGQGGHLTDTQPAAGPAPTAGGAPTPGLVNYNYGQSQAPGYGQPAPYPQSAPAQQSYGHGYDEPKYDTQAPTQQVYGQQSVSSQPGVYSQPGSTPQSVYTQQQPYNKPAYGGVPSQGLPQSYGPPRPSQPGDAIYQGHVPSSYGTMGPSQQPHPYGSSTPSQPAAGYTQPYGPSSGNADGYTQPPASYAQHGGQAAPGYAQGAQPASAYPQGGQSVGYGQYPSAQPSYGEQPVPNNASYGYQGVPTPDTGYGNSIPSAGYGVPPPASGQAGYVQPPSNSSGYEQSMQPQSGYGTLPGGAPVGYTKSLSPQPGYGQYDSAQMYSHH